MEKPTEVRTPISVGADFRLEIDNPQQEAQRVGEELMRTVYKSLFVPETYRDSDYGSSLDLPEVQDRCESAKAELVAYMESLKEHGRIISYAINPVHYVVSYTMDKRGHVLLILENGETRKPTFRSGPHRSRRLLKRRARQDNGKILGDLVITPVRPVEFITFNLTVAADGVTFESGTHDEQQ